MQGSKREAVAVIPAGGLGQRIEAISDMEGINPIRI